LVRYWEVMGESGRVGVGGSMKGWDMCLGSEVVCRALLRWQRQ
jgi:hypothetical protein